jgi:hypothetical protein
MRILSALCLVAALSAPVLAADPPTLSFEVVDAFRTTSDTAVVTGLLVGIATAYQSTLYYQSDETRTSCEKLALVALNKPGVFRFDVYKNIGNYTYACELVRRQP